MTDHKTVLVVFGERRRPVSFESGSTAKEELERLLEAVKVCFSDIISAREGPSTAKEPEFFLQKQSSEWGGLIDITGFVEDKEVVHLCHSRTANSQVCTLWDSMAEMYHSYTCT